MLNQSLVESINREYREIGKESIVISKGNSKMGVVPSVSVSAVVTCRADAPCTKQCYALNLERIRKNVKESYHKNLRVFLNDRGWYFEQVKFFCQMQRFFRWHVSGDIVNADYFCGMIEVAIACPHCKFLAFTKQYEIVNGWIAKNGSLPENLKIVFSNWGDWKCANPHNLPTAEVVFKGCEPLDDWKVCGGNCAECACRGVGCWEIKNGETICFNQH